MFFDGVDTLLWRTQGCGVVVGADLWRAFFGDLFNVVSRAHWCGEYVPRFRSKSRGGGVRKKIFSVDIPLYLWGVAGFLVGSENPDRKVVGVVSKERFFFSGHPIVSMGSGRISCRL